MLFDGICGTFDMESNYVGPSILNKLKKVCKIGYIKKYKRVIKFKKMCFYLSIIAFIFAKFKYFVK